MDSSTLFRIKTINIQTCFGILTLNIQTFGHQDIEFDSISGVPKLGYHCNYFILYLLKNKLLLLTLSRVSVGS